MPLTITLFYAGLLGLMLVAHSLRVVLLRRRLRVGLGSGGQEPLQRAVRVQANFCEYVPFGLVLLGALEAGAVVATWLLHLLGILLLAGRLLHAIGLSGSSGTSVGRFWGTFLTWAMIVIASLMALSLAIRYWMVV